MILRFVVIVSFFISIAAALGSFSLFSSYQSERTLRLDAEGKMIQIQDAAASAKSEIEQHLSKISDLEAEIEPLNAALTTLKTQVSSQNEKIQELEKMVGDKDSEINSLRSEVEGYKKKDRVPSAVITATAASSTPGVTTAATNSNVPAAKTAASPAVTVTAAKPSSSEAVTGAVAEASQASVIPAVAPESSDSRILTVNRKFNFIVVNLGLKDGLRMGDKVEVVQGTTQKALAQVEKIYDKFSAATLLSEDKGNPVHEGDTIRKL